MNDTMTPPQRADAFEEKMSRELKTSGNFAKLNAEECITAGNDVGTAVPASAL